VTDNHQVISDTFNNYFLSIINKIPSKINNDNNSMGVNITNPVDYLFQIYKNHFPEIKTDLCQLKKFKKKLLNP
jgi:hypothetical protein